MFQLRNAALGAVCAFLAATATAGPAAPLPLRDAVRNLWASSPQVLAAQAELEAARARARAASQPVYNPTLNLDGENADVDRRTVGASLAVDVTGKRRARMAESDAEVRAREAAYTLQRRDIAAGWLKAWSMAILSTAQEDLGRKRVELMRRFDELAARRLSVGDISSPERDLAGLALGEAQVQQAALAGQRASAFAALASLGENERDLPGLPQDLPPRADTIQPLAADERPELIQARAEQERAEAGVTVAQRARLPDPTFSLTGGQVRSGARTDRVIGVSVSIPLPVLNTGRADIDAARANADAAYATRRAERLRVDASLRQNATTYEALRAASEAFRRGRTNAFEERANTLERLWQSGEIGTSDYLVQLKQSLDTALAGLALESQAWQAWFDYLATAGRLTDWIDGPSQDASR